MASLLARSLSPSLLPSISLSPSLPPLFLSPSQNYVTRETVKVLAKIKIQPVALENSRDFGNIPAGVKVFDQSCLASGIFCQYLCGAQGTTKHCPLGSVRTASQLPHTACLSQARGNLCRPCTLLGCCEDPGSLYPCKNKVVCPP